MRLADTDLWLEVEEDRCAGGDEAVFGGGKTIRESMLQGTRTSAEGAPDLVITNVVVLDHWGIVKCDVGVRGGRICALGKAGNPDIADGVHPELELGPGTDVVAGEGRILTAGGIDCHVHLICPQIVDEALAAGMTTIIGGGTGPSEGSRATTCTPSPRALAEMLLAMDELPVNVLLLGKGNTVSTRALEEQLAAGAGGFKLHEDWGSTPAAIDACLRAADAGGVQVAIHSDTLNEAGYVRSTLAAIGGRTIHAYHTEGAGGGHAPDIIEVAGQANVLPSSTNPTRPHTVNTVAEHLDMLMVCHHLNPRIPEDLAFAESRIRGDHDRRRGRAPRPRRDLDDRLRRAGHGPRRRDDRAHVADRARDGPQARAATATSACGATSPSTRSARRSRTGSPARSAPSRSASSPTSCSGIPPSSRSGRGW